MQGDFEDVKRRIEKAVEMLEDVLRVFKSKPVSRAIEELRIALMEIEGLKRKSCEGIDHYTLKSMLVEELTKDGGSCYLESEGTGISKMRYRPDAVILKDDELIIVEVETDQRRMAEKIEKVSRVIGKIKSSPLATGRRVRVVFGVVEDLRDDLREKARERGFEVYCLSSGRLLKII